MKQRLVGRHDVFFFGPRKGTLATDVVWPKAIVVQGEDWSNDTGSAFTVVANVFILERLDGSPTATLTHFRCDDAEVVGDSDALLVLHLPSQTGVIVGESVQLMISWHPKDGFEQLRGQLKGCSEMFRLLADIAACKESAGNDCPRLTYI